MFNKKIFCNRHFRWIAIAIGITAACAGGSHTTRAATPVETAASKVEMFEGIALKQ